MFTIRNTRTLFIKVSCVAMLIGMVSAAQAYTGEELEKDAKVSISEARATALKVHPGKITDEELEKEPGGSGLRFTFVIKDGPESYEIGVDAQTGIVLENIVEGKNPD